MDLNIDCYTHIGRQHAACQDYARVGAFTHGASDTLERYEGAPPWYLAVADGCSASPDSDMGARFLVLGLENALLQEVQGCGLRALDFARRMAETAHLDTMSLDATLLYAVPHLGAVSVSIHGDGVIAARRRDGTVEHTVVKCPLNAPDYLSYYLDLDRKARYIERVESHNDGEGRGLRTYTSYEGSKVTSEMKIRSFFPVTAAFPYEEYDLVALMSDGVQSFMQETPTGAQRVPVHEVVEQIMAVKNTTGEFIVRRVRNGFLNRFCPKHGWHHYDDLAVAAIALGDSDG